MNWAEFIAIADVEGIELTDEIDEIVTTRKGFDVAYTRNDGYKGVIEIEEYE